MNARIQGRWLAAVLAGAMMGPTTAAAAGLRRRRGSGRAGRGMVVAAVVALGLTAAAGPEASAELIVYDGFDAQPGNLRGTSAGSGWNAAWEQGSYGWGSALSWAVDSPGRATATAPGR